MIGKKKYEYVLKEPLDPGWLITLNNANKTPQLKEYCIHEKTGRLSKRTREASNYPWRNWTHICKHSKDVNQCKLCFLKIEKKKKVRILGPNPTFGEVARHRRLTQKEKNKNDTDRNRHKNREQYLLSVGYKDTRKTSRLTCTVCLKVKVAVEDSNNRVLLENETFGGTEVTNARKVIQWVSKCNICRRKADNNSHLKGGARFILNQISSIRIHTNETPDDGRKRLIELCRIDRNCCYTCNVPLIKHGKAGFAQMSINNLNPDQKDLTVLHLSCVACNLCQNKLPYLEFLKGLISITKNIDTSNMNCNPLNEHELKWLQQGIFDNTCPTNIRLHVAEKYGRYCVYTGLEVCFSPNKFNTASFDRINSKLPYSKEQTQLVCKHLNYMKKGAITENELYKWLDHLFTNRQFIQDRYFEYLNKI